jgi:pimeloyl-ACP methyl ester carboxylesterase
VTLQRGENDAWGGTIDIPQQGAKGLRLGDVLIEPPSVSFRIQGVPGDPTIRLTLSADGQQMSGTLTQGGGTVPVSLARGEAKPVSAPAPRRPQTPSRPVPYIEEDITFRNDVAQLRLAGTLTRPRGTDRAPAVLLITGSGQQDRDETVFDHKPFWVWADHLTRMGVAVLRVDDRGIGGSERGPAAVTSMDFATDVRAGLAYLRSRPEIDPKRIGLIGHSEGAMLAAMVAADNPDVRFTVMLAGPGLPGDRILFSQAELIFRAQGATDAVIAWDRAIRERVFAALRAEADGKPNQPARQRLLEEIASTTPGATGVPDGAAGRRLAEALFAQLSQPWFRFFLSFDPRPSLMKVTVPVLAVGGERDLQVPSKDNLPAIEQAIRANGNKDVTVASLPELNHLFQTSKTGSPAEYATIEETISPAVLKLVSDWVAKHVL